MAEEQEQSNKKKLPLKTILILAAVFVIEGAVIAGVFMMAGKPAEVKAEGAAQDEAALADELIEELVVSAKFPNTKRGRTYIYDSEVYVVVQRKNQSEVRSRLDGMSAQISGDIRTVISRAEPSHLLEPTLATVKRQIKAALDGRLGRDEDGQSRVVDVVITRFTQFRADL
jgi:flagellar basal body-associated protein FliL